MGAAHVLALFAFQSLHGGLHTICGRHQAVAQALGPYIEGLHTWAFLQTIGN
jgi:hypothetical protein